MYAPTQCVCPASTRTMLCATVTKAHSNRSASLGAPARFVVSFHRGQFRAKERSELLRLAAQVRKDDLALKAWSPSCLHQNDPLSALVAVGFLTG